MVGNRPELGNWDPFDCAAAGLQLRTGAAQYPCWAMSAPVWIELGTGGRGRFADGGGADEEDEEDADGEAQDSNEEEDSDHGAETPGSSGAAALVGAGVGLAPARQGDFVRLEYKYVKDRRQMPDGGPSIQWEESIANRRVMVPQEHGSMWIISDLRFNDNSEPQIRRTTLAEVLARRVDLDPEWTSHQRDIEAPEWAVPHREDLSSPGSGTTSCSRHTTSTVFMM